MPQTPPLDPVFSDIIAWAKGVAIAQGAEVLDATHVLLGAFKSPKGRAILIDLLHSDSHPERKLDPAIKGALSRVEEPVPDRRFNLAPRLKSITDDVWRQHGELKAETVLKGVLGALRDQEAWVRTLIEQSAGERESAGESGVMALKKILTGTDTLREALGKRIVGQSRAIDMVCDAYFATELTRNAGSKDEILHPGPRMILTFLGPPGVGKTYMAEIIAEHLKSGEAAALLRLDMSAYSTHQAHEQLVGFNPSYTGSNKGLLTSFAIDHPDGFVLIDEIEKAHLNTQNLFLQILDSGRLFDNNLRQEVDFSRTTLVFTTNLGRELYDAPERSGFLRDSQYLNDAILQTLGREATNTGPEGGGLTPELLSRMAKGHVVLFDRLGGLALERIADLTIRRISDELRSGIGIGLDVSDPLLLTLLVLRFGANGDARRLTTGLRNYLYTAVKDLLHDQQDLLLDGEDPLLPKLTGLRLSAPRTDGIPPAITETLAERSHVLLLDDDDWTVEKDSTFLWEQARSQEDADAVLRKGRTSLILLDLHIGARREERVMENGLLLLRWLRSRFPQVPVYLFSESPEKRGLSADALVRVSEEGGAAGILQKRFYTSADQETLERDSFFRRLREVDVAQRRQRLVEQFQRRFKIIEFDLHMNPIPTADGAVLLELRGLREVTAVTARDRDLTGWVDLPRERFEDVAGAEQAKERLEEIVRWLRDPRPVLDLGLDMPKGILLTGPPGTGKTTLARAVAGESSVPFFAISGSEVYNKYVGESEGAIRRLFAAARRYAPAVLFIDEIDSIGSARGESQEAAWRTGVLNELLAQMDGFKQGSRPVFVLAATNRPDILDPALIRSGRFDLQIDVPNPSAPGREGIFKIHLRGMKLAPDVDIPGLARRTAGMSGADIKQVCKEAGFLALRAGRGIVGQADLDEAITIVRFGLASERALLDDATKWSTAVHEAGHALAQRMVFPGEPVSQVSILPRGRALGFTEHVPGKHYSDQSLARIKGEVRVLLAGRVAEEMLLGGEGITSGCSDDLERATTLTVQMISSWGMDERIGLLNLRGVKRGLQVADGMPFESATQEAAIVASKVWLGEQRDAVRAMLEGKREPLRAFAQELVKRETITGTDLTALLG
jgi:ATP-dependent metalloprotease FtsH